MKLDMLNKLRQQNPVVLNAANFVTVQDVANGLNAIGASPIMSQEIEEAEEMAQLAASITLNLGTLTKLQVEYMEIIAAKAASDNKPIILDPVAVGASKYRLDTAIHLLSEFPIQIIRGNAGEIATLGNFEWQSKGIDAGDGNDDLDEITLKTAQKFNCVVIASGATDTISDGTHITHIYNGTSLFQAHVGSGDMLSSIVAAFAAVEKDPYEAAIAATLIFAATGELLVKNQPQIGPGSFGMYLLDYLAEVQPADIEKIAHFN
jgi:hydroxyethylthiazole kinase